MVSSGGSGTAACDGKLNAWTQAQLSAFDLRSDVTTAASRAQLEAVLGAGVNDGWSAGGAGPAEARVAELTGRPAALLVASSTMGNHVAIRTHLGRPPNGIVCDARAHIMHMEVGALGHLSGALPLAVTPANGLYLTVEDIEPRAVVTDGRDSCACPTRLIHVENPLGGVVMPLSELRRIHAFAAARGIAVHMDGARLWEAAAAGHGSLRDFCAAADSVNLCLTKGLGGSVGSVLVGDAPFVHHAGWVRKSFGGSLRQPGLVAAAAWAAVEDVFGAEPGGGQAAKLRRSHGLARRIAAAWTGLGGRLVVPQQTNMVWLDLDAAGIAEEAWEAGGLERGLRLHCSRVVTHYQIADEAVDRLLDYMADAMRGLSVRQPLSRPVPRSDAVARVAFAMREAADLARLRGRWAPDAAGGDGGGAHGGANGAVNGAASGAASGAANGAAHHRDGLDKQTNGQNAV